MVPEVWCQIPVGDTWHLDEVYLRIAGRNQYLWRAVDQEGEVIDILVQSHRDSRAAERFFRKILRVQGTLPRRVITDRLGSYGVAMKKLMPGVEQIKDKGANHRLVLTKRFAVWSQMCGSVA